jgi:UDP-N-acetylmuramyl pentapeptide phosphotransferase/UDP-N-acetylglucosamine-1-phosphate transferase
MQLAWVLAAAAATLLVAHGGRELLRAPVLRRRNYAGRDVATAGGMFAVFGFVVALGVHALFDFDAGNWQVASVVVVVGFAALGLFDDLVGDHSARGLRGHVRAAIRGELTSGAVKLLVGVAVALVATAPLELDTERRLLAAVVIAGAANVANLLDLAPGRLTKVGVVAAIALAVAVGAVDPILGPLMFVAAVVVLVPAEFREQLMLGDAGANAFGACVGLMAVVAADRSRVGLWLAAAIVVLINLAGELVSFSEVIERVPPLRVLDRLGRRA